LGLLATAAGPSGSGRLPAVHPACQTDAPKRNSKIEARNSKRKLRRRPVSRDFESRISNLRPPSLHRRAETCAARPRPEATGSTSALVAAVFGPFDYIGVKMSPAAFRRATLPAVSASALGLYAVSLMLRRNRAAEIGPSRPPAVGLEVAGFVSLGV
jgi:hypothetical protein